MSLVFPLVFVILGVPCGALVDRIEVRTSLRIIAVGMVGAALLRVLGARYELLLSGQILFALVQPLVLSLIVRLADVWFPANERLRATEIGSMAPTCGHRPGIRASTYDRRSGSAILAEDRRGSARRGSAVDLRGGSSRSCHPHARTRGRRGAIVVRANVDDLTPRAIPGDFDPYLPGKRLLQRHRNLDGVDIAPAWRSSTVDVLNELQWRRLLQIPGQEEPEPRIGVDDCHEVSVRDSQISG